MLTAENMMEAGDIRAVIAIMLVCAGAIVVDRQRNDGGE